MFVGTVPSSVRGILKEIARGWGAQAPVHVGCSGNFTIEAALSDLGRPIHSNDVSMYSGAIGAMLTGQPFRLEVKSEPHAWMNQYIRTPTDAVATLVLCLEYLEFSLKDKPYYRRTWAAVQQRFGDLHAKTRAKVQAAAGKVNVASYSPCDVVDFIERAPPEAGAMAFPPTYAGGYERLFKALSTVFDWDEPAYTPFDEARMSRLVERITDRPHWALYWDRDIPELNDRLAGYIHTSARNHPVRIYASASTSRLVTVRQVLEPVPLARVTDRLGGEMSLVVLRQGQLNTLRSEYLSANIIPASAHLALGVLVGEQLAGAIAFNTRPSFGDWCDAYLLSDFAVAPTAYPRLSKLVLAAALSAEVREVLRQRAVGSVDRIGTTAFTDKPVSMKYRGLFELHSRKPGRLNYVAESGRWTLSEALQWWTSKYGKTSSGSTSSERGKASD